jgi:hypothetical protein
MLFGFKILLNSSSFNIFENGAEPKMLRWVIFIKVYIIHKI